ncbi:MULTISPECIES: alpha/beta hydrolase [unclassified Sphingopyxis]|uniref:alpha/beta hydrolase n=1 Tax=unclassified Sphingopyxis TaxID=2614943 RepID=UPI00285A696D|nr:MULTISPECIES: alpha/beta hydrolase [unclassified Sphingopyxis]MDR6834560.1 acetyl esterase/lipase [Sphingopyxis sp. BE122]MDR7226830.1 acetyl esterase/lipase [Sphingopyxis sp. BE259]
MSKRIWIGLAAVTAVVASGMPVSDAREKLRDRLRERMAERMGAEDGAKVPGGETIAYGSDALQVLDVWRAKAAKGPAPLIVYVHGGGWKRGSKDNATGRFKPVHYPGQGYAFASINYRLVPAATVEQQAADVASAVKALIDRASALGIDRRRIVLMGHSAGAHLVALVGTDERYLRGAGLSFADIAGVIPNDGAAYDVPAQMKDGPPIMQATYKQAFGTDPARQKALSPTAHAAAPNAREFLLLYVQREDGVRQAKALGASLTAGGSRVEHGSFPGEGLKGHAEINRSLGDPAYAATGAVDAWLKRVFAK